MNKCQPYICTVFNYGLQFSRPQTTDYPHVKQSEQKLAATTYQMLQREVLTDDYVSGTLDRLADRPTAQGRQQTLNYY